MEPQSLQLQLQPTQETKQLSVLAQSLNHLQGIEIAQNIPDFLEWYFKGVQQLSESGLLIFTIGGRNSSGKSSSAEAIRMLLQTKPDSLEQALSEDYSDVLNYLKTNPNFRILSLPITSILEVSKQKGWIDPSQKTGGLSQINYRKLTSKSFQLIMHEIEKGYSSKNPLVLIIQKGVPTIYPKDQIYNPNATEANLNEFLEYQKQWNGFDRLETITHYLGTHLKYRESVFPLYLIRDPGVLRIGKSIRSIVMNPQTDISDRLETARIRVIQTATPENYIDEPLSPEDVEILNWYLRIGQMPAHKINQVTRQQQDIIKYISRKRYPPVHNEESLYRYLLEASGICSVNKHVLIGSNELIFHQPSVDLNLLSTDIAFCAYLESVPLHFRRRLTNP